MNIRTAIQQLAQGALLPMSVCTVDRVNRQARTVDCTPLDGSAPLLGINLQANQGSTHGVVLLPKVGSYVVVGLTAGGVAGVVLATDEVAEVLIDGPSITINGGDNGGMVNIGELVKRLNALVSTFNTHTHAVGEGATLVPNASASSFAARDFEDTQIKH